MIQSSYNKDNKKQETRNTTDKGSLILAEEPQTKKSIIRILRTQEDSPMG